MKQHEVKNFLPILEAWGNGGQLQYNFCPDNDTNWADVSEAVLHEPPNCYRIKPTPRFRPWKPEEVPVGALIRCSNSIGCFTYLIVAVIRDKIRIIEDRGIVDHACSFYHNERYTYSTDHGKTWHPCGVLEDQP